MILVMGATGMLGGMITQQLLAQGQEVRILARENSPSEALSWRDVVAGVAQVIGQDLPVHFVQPGEPVPLLPKVLQGPAAMLDTYDSPVPRADTAATYGVTLTPLATVLLRMFGAH